MTIPFIGIAMLMGACFGLQISMLSAMARTRGPLEATWLSLVATIAGFALVMTARTFSPGVTTALPSPFRRPPAFAVIAAIAIVGVAVVVRGLPWYFMLTGLFAVPLLVSAGYLGPRLGVGLYLSSVVAGQMICSVVLDHIGAFGIAVHRVGVSRVAGIGALIAGVVLIRGVGG